MTQAARTVPAGRDTLARIANGLRMLTVPLPHLSGLAAAVKVDLDSRVPTMGIFASGRLIANPQFVARLKENELVFVLAHELLHLALRTHDRAKGSGITEFNYAHDYIINDMLRVELGFAKVPAGGLDMPGARKKSAEQMVLEMRRNADRLQSRSQVWEGETIPARRVFGSGPAGRAQGDGRATASTRTPPATCSATSSSATCFRKMPKARRGGSRRYRISPPKASRSPRQWAR